MISQPNDNVNSTFRQPDRSGAHTHYSTQIGSNHGFIDNQTYFLPLGICGGNNAVKVYVPKDLHHLGRILMPTAIVESKDKADFSGVNVSYAAADSAKFTYKKGAWLGLKGRTFIVGQQASNMPGRTEVGQAAAGKIEYLPHQILAVITAIVSSPDFVRDQKCRNIKKLIVPIVLSVPYDSQVAQVEKTAFSGKNFKHTILLNGDKNRELEIEFQYIQALAETRAAGLFLACTTGIRAVALFDAGNGNTIYSFVDATGNLVSHEVDDDSDSGVRYIIDRLSACDSALETFKRGIPYHEVRKHLEAGNLTPKLTGSTKTWDYQEDYEKILDSWLPPKLAKFQKMLASQTGFDKVMVIGGGALLPGLKDRFLDHGIDIEVPADPQFIDAVGLAWIANAMSTKPKVAVSA